ncbi:hypothetical protein SAMN00120144_3713 [Hymenobacter roseosalivarius DSM 11622]|uniref:Uncharacterized protein n=1 Tax=Hymenobacter roseosalivarius DSM 11622 TaxID=645990 RepID=A0A1W1W1Y3_9BACT|nr:hypothetical protein [Hymenobacter roseosalivarius]SMB99635.1 hypothetical protein SAMN00120144_3713 [Hymenobacter roseosalivarius DSM 11622]
MHHSTRYLLKQPVGSATATTASWPADISGVERQVLIRVDEVAPEEGTRGQAEAVKEALVASGAKAGELQSTTDEQGIRHSEVKVSYRTDQPELTQVSLALNAVAAQPGSQVVENDSHRAERHDLTRGQQQFEGPARSAEVER